ncbi:hypothetical protein BDB01DRAFT_584647 [Pilobolus umbonatus]|nr:hypothetical protein BDB01DRAFT_584647 [Pilobolus umbonatus]
MNRRFDYAPRDRYIYPRIRDEERLNNRENRQYRPMDRIRDWPARSVDRYPYPPPRRYPYSNNIYPGMNSYSSMNSYHYMNSYPSMNDYHYMGHHNLNPPHGHIHHSHSRPPFNPERYHSNHRFHERRLSPRREYPRQRAEDGVEEERKRIYIDKQKNGKDNKQDKQDSRENKREYSRDKQGNVSDSLDDHVNTKDSTIIPTIISGSEIREMHNIKDSSINDKNNTAKEVVVSLDSDEEDRLMQADWGNDSDDDSVVVEHKR